VPVLERVRANFRVSLLSQRLFLSSFDRRPKEGITLPLILGKVTSLYMPQRASQRKFGKSLKLNLAKQKK
jgi:hypothetical protein